MRTERLRVARTARYHVLGEASPDLREVWFCLHGYGQLAAEFLGDFDAIADPSRLLVAPEGLSRHYRDGGGGAVGASWMTKEDRASEITDYLEYLDALHARVFAQVERDAVRLHVLGFSQGTATACRWVARGAVRADRLTLWAGLVPPDVDLAAAAERYRAARLAHVIGERDHWVSEKDVEQERARLADHGLELNLTRFAGGHRLDDGTLAALAGSVGL